MKKRIGWRLVWTAALLLLAAGSGRAAVLIEEAFPGLSFTRPVDFQHPGDGSNRLFVVEQSGRILVFDNRPDVTETDVFLDIRDRVDDQGNEEGLLGLAFHPDFESNGFFYVDYTAAGPDRTVISRFSVSEADPNRADLTSEHVLLEVAQPYSNHNAGQILFGPDGYFYITLGDGGAGGDPQGNGQNPGTLLGSILRVDLDHPDPDMQYGIPDDNPFADNTEGYREEIFAYGLRNPWRISFDSETGDLWAADVGQDMYEEIDIIEKGANYGWNIMEGLHCYNAASCDRSGLTPPVWEYSHDLGQSVTGGFVYRGSDVPELVGDYVYADYVSGRVWRLRPDNGGYRNLLIEDTDLNIASFGADGNNELYMTAFDGSIYRFVTDAVGVGRKPETPDRPHLFYSCPNPFNAQTRIELRLERPAPVSLELFDIRGRQIRVLSRPNRSVQRITSVWNGEDRTGLNVCGGVYFCRLRTPAFQNVIRLVYLP